MKIRHSIRKLFTGVLLGAASLSCASASTFLVNWGGSYLEEGTQSAYTSRGTTSINQASLKGVLYGYNDSTPVLAPTASNKYSGTSATFYGAVQLTTPQVGTGSQIRVRSTGNTPAEDWSDRNRIYIQSPSASTTAGNVPANVQGMLFWKKEDFLAGSGSDPIALSQLDHLHVNASYGRVSNSTIRFAIQSNGEWYLSQHALTTGQKLAVAIGTLTLSDLSNSLWGQWDVQDSPTSLLNVAPTTYDIQGSTLTDVTAVGFYFSGSYSLSNSVMFGFEEFSVTVIPEPSTAMMLGGTSLVLLGGMAAKRRARKH